MVEIKSYKDARKVIYEASKKAIKKSFKDLSAWFLVISNIIVIFLLIYNNLAIFNLLWVYVCQSVILGILWFIKGYLYHNANISRKGISNYIFSYFLVHLIYVFAIFGIMRYTLLFANNTIVNYQYIFSGIAVFALNHLVSFIINFKKDKRKIRSLEKMQLVSAPYIRIIPMHLLVLFYFLILAPLFYFFSIFSKLANTILAIIFLLLKIYIDVLMHAKEHE